jgi:TRAP-type C4-dicarboxylate transport system permease small subunit
MPKIFDTLDKLKPVYDKVYEVVLFICKLLLIADILITIFAVAGRYIPFIPYQAWSEEIVLTLMSYMAVLSAALAIRRNAHIRMTAFDRYLHPKLILVLDILSDITIFILTYVMITVGWKYAILIGSRGNYTSMPNVSRRWMYFPVPVAGVAMLLFEVEVFYNHMKSIWTGKVKTTSEVSTYES